MVWFRSDLRLKDNPSWAEAARAHDEVLPLVAIDPQLINGQGRFRRTRWLANVASLAAELAELGGPLTIAEGVRRRRCSSLQ
jgi:deoxyribodipyrimidine photolyase